tara:strand:+ start:35 stop:235 length:201 start_codon:yes stop_codon:yes gene_type:complete
MKSRNDSMMMVSFGWSGILITILFVLLTSCGTFKMTEKEKEINYKIDKLYLEYTYKRDSLIIEYNK